MTLQSWKAEFYSVGADCVAKKDAIAHSLQKWTGLLHENLEKHDCFIKSGWVYGQSGQGHLEINGETCALCLCYFGPGQEEHVECPLYDVRRANCDNTMDNEGLSPWYMWRDEWDPRPMIALLQEALERQKQQEES
jgi:hypothetical protein